MSNTVTVVLAVVQGGLADLGIYRLMVIPADPASGCPVPMPCHVIAMSGTFMIMGQRGSHTVPNDP
jgi:hypothetical protein